MNPTLSFTEDLIWRYFSQLFDDSGVSMYEHMKRVHARVADQDIETQHIAWLHDLVEDTDVTITELISMGYSTEVVDAVYLLSKPKKMPYADYIDHLISSGNQRAIRVKIADNADNNDPHRWLMLNPYRAQALTKRYAGVREKLIGALK